MSNHNNQSLSSGGIHGLPNQFITTSVNGKNKIPIDTRTGRACDPLNPDSWMSYVEACALSPTVGFVLTKQDPYVFLDFDDCLDETGQWSSHAVAAVQPYIDRGAACEVSISGTGMHILCLGDQILMEPLRSKIDGWRERYNHSRFIQFGGTGHGGWQGDPRVDWTDIITATWPPKETLDADGIPETGPIEDWEGPTDDDVLIQTILQTRPSAAVAFGSKAPFKALWNGDRDTLARFYPSSDPAKPWDASSAEAALAAHLAFWTGKDLARIQRLIERSGVRHTPDQKKYQRPSYLMPTIRDAARLVENVYKKTPHPSQENTPLSLPAGDAPQVGRDLSVGDYMTIHDQMKHFVGCVYVRDHH